VSLVIICGRDEAGACMRTPTLCTTISTVAPMKSIYTWGAHRSTRFLCFSQISLYHFFRALRVWLFLNIPTESVEVTVMVDIAALDDRYRALCTIDDNKDRFIAVCQLPSLFRYLEDPN
jgi:hypothetical protein